jgi:hypothetical protein
MEDPMAEKLKLSLFVTRNAEGECLREILVPLAEQRGFSVEAPFREITQWEYAQACAESDVVILDASIAPRGEHNYSFTMPTALDYVLVVSRIYLPLNFYGLRDSIRDPDKNELIYGAPFYPKTQDNQEIARWVELQLEDLLPKLPRPKRGVLGTLFRGQWRSSDAVDERRHREGQIFISYRSSDDPEVLKLKERIESGGFPGVPAVPVRYFPPATLSDELATEQRRWQILSTIDRFIGPASEVWIYLSQEYFNSWWTLGELAALSYRGINGYRGKSGPRVRIYDPQRDALHDLPEGWLPAMSQEQNRRMARWYANSDTAEMGPESVVVMRMMANMPLVGRLKYFRDPVWSDEFWRHPILDCAACRKIGERGTGFDVDDFLWTRGPGFQRLTPEEMALCVEQREVVCPNPACGTHYEVYEDKPQYLWMPVINGNVTARYWMLLFDVTPEDPEEQFLVPLPTYRVRMPWSLGSGLVPGSVSEVKRIESPL